MGRGMYQRFLKGKTKCLDWIEVDLGDNLWRKVLNRKLKNRLMKGKPGISAEDRVRALDFWSPFTTKFNLQWIQFYSLCHGSFDPRYIPDDLYYTIICRHLNNQALGRGLADKNYLSRLYPETRQPNIVIRKIGGHYCDVDYRPLSEAEAVRLCETHRELVFKPSVDTHGGENVVFWRGGAPQAGEVSLENHLRAGMNLVVQEPIRQHEVMMQLHGASVNTIRMTTLLKDGSATMLSALVRMGVDGKRVDNAWAGGVSCGIQEDGRLKNVAFTINGKRMDRHPQGAVFEDCVIPNYHQFVELAKPFKSKHPIAGWFPGTLL